MKVTFLCYREISFELFGCDHQENEANHIPEVSEKFHDHYFRTNVPGDFLPVDLLFPVSRDE